MSIPWSPMHFERGVGPLSSIALKSIIASSEWLRTNRAALDALIHAQTRVDHASFLARITSTVLIGGCSRRWRYTVEPVTIEDTSTIMTVDASTRWRLNNSGGLLTALNLCEFAIASPLATDPPNLGDGTLAANIPAGFAVVPIAGIVQCFSTRGTDGKPFIYFDRTNGIDGACPA